MSGFRPAGRYNKRMETTLTQPSQSVILPGISWATYESLLKDYAAFAGVRLNYDRGKLEIMTPGPEHENFSRKIEDAAAAIAEAQERDIEPYGSMTFKRADIERGFEPDSCFYIERAEEMRDRKVIDLSVDPAPELVIEVDDTSPSLQKLPLYASVGVREVWRYKNGKITIYGLDDGAYSERENSLAFPELSRTKLEEFIEQSRTMRRPDWMRGIREWAGANKR